MLFWGVEIKPGKPYLYDPAEVDGVQLHLSQATLSLSAKSKERVGLAAKVEGLDEILICSLSAGGTESVPLDIIFDREVKLLTYGPSSIHVTGYYMPADKYHEEDEDDEDDYDDEEGVEFDSDEMDEFAELGYEEDDEDSEDDELSDRPPLRASGVTIEEVTDEEALKAGGSTGLGLSLESPKVEEAGEDDKKDDLFMAVAKVTGKKAEKENASKKSKKKIENGDAKVDEEDEDGFVTNKRPPPATGAEEKSKKKLAVASGEGTPVAVEARAEDTKAEITEPVEKDSSKNKKNKKNKKKGAEVQANVVTGTVEASPDVVTKLEGKGDKVDKIDKKGSSEGVVPAAGKEKEKDSSKVTENEKNKEEGKGKGKGKAKEVAVEKKTQEVSPAGKAKSASPVVRKYPNGLEVHELSMGNPSGKQAKAGKKISMHYTGKLKSNNKVFDSSIGKKAFSFRLGIGEVIKGWDVGVLGMRVGDKRRLVIPPQMGYGPKGSPPVIPGNAWLIFDIELIDVK